MYVGIPYAPISAAYSLMSTDFGKLRMIIDLLTPGLVFASRRRRLRARHRCRGAGRCRAGGDAQSAGRPQGDAVRRPAAAPKTEPSVAAAHAKVAPDTIAKFLFTSGSTGPPKAVINTHRMLCSNQAMIARRLLPSSPTSRRSWSTGCPGAIPSAATTTSTWCSSTAARSISTTAIRRRRACRRPCAICARSRRPSISTCRRATRRWCRISAPTSTLRKNFFSRLKVLFYAGAGLNQTTWDELHQACHRDHRRAHHLSVLARLDRDRAAGARLHDGISTGRAISACRRPASNSSWCRTKASWRRACADRTSRPAIGGRTTDHARGLRRGRLLQDRRRAEIRRSQRSGQRSAVRRPHRRGFQALDRHLGQRRPLARAFHRSFRALCARRGVRRRRPRRHRRAGVSRRRGLPQARRSRRRCRARSGARRSRGCAPNLPSCSTRSPREPRLVDPRRARRS